jgi:S1-C subfamily serine protease
MSDSSEPHKANADHTPLPDTPVSWPIPQSPRASDGAWSGGQVVSGRAFRRSLAAVVLVAAVVGAVAGYVAGRTNGATQSFTFTASSDAPGGAVLPSGTTIPKLVKRVSPSVVSVDVRSAAGEDQGTGMIISSNGLVLTNNHVIDAVIGGGIVTVTLSGQTKALPATVVGRSVHDDVALLRIENATQLQAVTFGNTAKLEVGDAVVAIGNALALSASTPTVTQGIVSALGRTVSASAGTSGATETLYGLIQTDAAINPGNSGGPLLDDHGHVIGMNTAAAGSTSDGTNAQNIGFAIPADRLQALLPELAKGAGISSHPHAYLGVEILSNDSQVQAEYGLTPSTGALVVSVTPGSGAALAGLASGDVIVGLDTMTIGSAQDVATFMARHHAGQRVLIRVYRGDQVKTFTAVLGLSAS